MHVGESVLVPPDSENTLAVVVTYYPDEALTDNVRATLAHARHVLIVDNTPTPEVPLALAYVAEIPGVNVLRLGRNAGIGAALNHGIDAMRAGSYEWLLTLDQDTRLLSEYSAITREAAAQAGPTVGLIGVNYAVAGLPVNPTREGITEAETVITSGTLLRAACARTCGRFREDYFIDAVDTEYSLRARAAGFTVVLALRPGMDHALGRAELRQFLGGTRRTLNYPPSRIYFIVRNGVMTLRRYTAREPAWAKGEVKRTAYLIVVALTLEEDRWAKLLASVRGLFDGLTGRMGALEGTPPYTSTTN